MTNREKKEYMLRYQILDREIDRLLDERKKWRERAEKITPSYSDMPRGGEQNDKVCEAVTQIVEIEERINREIDSLVQLEKNIFRMIHSVSNPKLQLVLKYRYIDGLTYDEIANKMHYDIRHVHRMHGWALRSIRNQT